MTASEKSPAVGVTDGSKDISIDWEGVRARLRRLHAASVSADPPEEERRRILRERAVLLGRPSERDEDTGGELQVLEFALAQERYAVESSAVREVYTLKEITPVPGTPSFILGVVNVRGRICSVVDLGQLFGSPMRDMSEYTMVIVLASAAMEFAILADEVIGMRTIATSALQTSLPTLTGMRQKYLRGVTPERVAVLDAHRILSDETLVMREERGVVR